MEDVIQPTKSPLMHPLQVHLEECRLQPDLQFLLYGAMLSCRCLRRYVAILFSYLLHVVKNFLRTLVNKKINLLILNE